VTPDDPPRHWLERALDVTPLRLTLWLWLVMIPLSAVFHSPRHGGFTLDWQFFQFFDEIARKTLLEHHQLPIWNPYFCGGTTFIGNPQTTFLVPTFPLVLWFGTTFGQRLSNIVVLVVGCEGAWRLARWLGVRRLAALVAPLSFPFFIRIFHWIHDGQHGLPGWALAMWVFYGYLRGLERPVYLALGGAFFAWIMCYRGIETVPELALVLGVWALLETRRRIVERKGWRQALWPLGACAALGLLALGFAGLRMAPVLELVLKYPRVVPEPRSFDLSHVFVEFYAIPPFTRPFSGPGYAYIGPVVVLLTVGALAFSRVRRRAGIALACLLVCNLLALGENGFFSPYPLLRRLPLYASLRQPALWTCAGVLFLSLAATLCTDELDRWLRARGRRSAWLAAVLVPLIVLGMGADLLARARDAIGGRNNPFTWAPATRVKDEFRQSRGNHFLHPMFPYLDRGTLSCYDETPFPASPALRPDLPDEEYLADPTAGTVTRVRWTPRKIELSADLLRPATVLVNQNWQPGWHSSAGTVRNHQGLVAIDLPAGRTRFTLSMWPPMCTVGLLLMLAALGATAWLWRRDRLVRAAPTPYP
jgi:hypothetical protein